MIDKGIPGRVRVIFALARLDAEMRGEVLADGSILKQFNITAEAPIKLADNVVVPREKLFEAFARAAAGSRTSLELSDSLPPAAVQIDADGSATVELERRSWRFAYAGLLAGDPQKRSEFLDAILAQLTLTRETVASLRARVGQPDWSHDSFLDVAQTLDSAPESFARHLEEKSRTGAVRERDMLPESPLHWEHLTAKHEASRSLVDFVETELFQERKSRLERDAERALRGIALSFAAPKLVPHEQLNEVAPIPLMQAVEGISSEHDHFTLVGAFEICANRVAEDSRYVPIGERILDQLVPDVDELLSRCAMFAAAFVLSTARLSTSTATRAQPPFWRRLAAATHASLIVRTCGVSGTNRKTALDLAIQERGREYLLSVLSDMWAEPRWDPEWIEPNILAADALGRVFGAAMKLGDKVPSSWQDRIQKAKAWVEENRLWMKTQYPAVLEGAQVPDLSKMDDEFRKLVSQDYARLTAEPSVQNALRVTSWVEILGPPAELAVPLKTVLEQTHGRFGQEDASRIEALFSLASHVSVLSKDIGIGDSVAQAFLSRAQKLIDRQSLMEAVLRLTQVSGADQDRGNARRVLARRLEILSFNVPLGEAAEELVEMLLRLQSVDDELAPLLGAALHTARLAMRPSPVG